MSVWVVERKQWTPMSSHEGPWEIYRIFKENWKARNFVEDLKEQQPHFYYYQISEWHVVN